MILLTLRPPQLLVRSSRVSSPFVFDEPPMNLTFTISFHGRFQCQFHYVFFAVHRYYCWVRSSIQQSATRYAKGNNSFLSGTVLIEIIIKALSRTPVNQERSAWIPYINPTASKNSQSKAIRDSFLQAQHLSLVLGSLMHGSFFVMMGSTGGYITIFLAYVISAFARAILTGQSARYFVIYSTDLASLASL